MKTLHQVVKFKANSNETKCVPFLNEGEMVWGVVTGFTPGDDSKAIVTAAVGNHFYKFYRFENELTIVVR